MIGVWLSVALAGPPYHACDVAEDGRLGLISPSDGRVAVLDGDTLEVVADLGRPEGHWVHLLYAAKGGGWFAGPETRLAADGTVSAAKAEPAAMWSELEKRHAADHRGDTVYAWDEDQLSVVRVDRSKRTALWTISDLAHFPKGLAVIGDTVYALQNVGIRVQPLAGKPSTLAEPEQEPIGLCGAPDGPLHAVVYAEKYQVCVLRSTGDAWTRVACLDPAP